MKKAIYPGSFDPIHKGHLEVISKALKLFDFLYVVVTFNLEKPTQSRFEKRFAKAQEMLRGFKNVEVLVNKNIPTAKFAKELKVNFLVRSARNDTDFQYELELATGNRVQNKELETIIIVPELENINYQSRLIAQIGVKK